MPEIKYKVKLSPEEEAMLREITHKGSKIQQERYFMPIYC